MNLPPSAVAPVPSSSSSAPRRNWPRLLLNIAVTIVVLAVAAAAFVLSYPGVHAIALQGGVSAQLARIYPGLFDAVLVIACVAAVVLRDGPWWARSWAWLVVIVVLGAIGATDVLHAADYTLRHRLTEGIVAAAPAVAVLLAFSLLLTMLRQSRPRPSAADHGPQGVAGPIDATTTIDGFPVVAAGAVPRPPAPPIALPAAPAPTAEVPVLADHADGPEQPAGIGQERPDLAYLPDSTFAPDSAFAADSPDSPDSPTAPTREEPVLPPEAPGAVDTVTAPDDLAAPAPADAPADEEPADRPAPGDLHSPTEPNEVLPADPPAAASGAEESSAEESSTEPSRPTQAPEATRPGAIRFASSAAGESDSDYWEADVDPALAGQVYPVLTSDPDIDTSGYQPGERPDVDDLDAPPFATAPFASVPRLNRMRVSPIPPADDEDPS